MRNNKAVEHPLTAIERFRKAGDIVRHSRLW